MSIKSSCNFSVSMRAPPTPARSAMDGANLPRSVWHLAYALPIGASLPFVNTSARSTWIPPALDRWGRRPTRHARRDERPPASSVRRPRGPFSRTRVGPAEREMVGGEKRVAEHRTYAQRHAPCFGWPLHRHGSSWRRRRAECCSCSATALSCRADQRGNDDKASDIRANLVQE